jgi:hypothetical protein
MNKITNKTNTEDKMKTRINTPMDWQKVAENVTTRTVQFWRNGTMVTAQMKNERARELVKDKMAFVICEQAIGALDQRGNRNA